MKLNKNIVLAIRLVLGAVFVFSGFVKAVDPWGTAIKIGEYLTVFGLDWFDWVKFPASIILSGFELMLGLMLITGIRLRLASLLTMLFMICMTGLTLYSAIADPVSDCGCFGDAVKLSNWETFFKNLVLLPMAIVVWYNTARSDRFTLKDGLWLGLMAIVSFGIGVYSYRHLPLIDFLPYKIGVDLKIEEAEDHSRQSEPKVVYRDVQTGKQQTFSLTDTTWYDTNRWEWVETLDTAPAIGIKASTRDFKIYDGAADITDNLIHAQGEVMMVIALDINQIKGRCKSILDKAVKQAYSNSQRVVLLTSSPLPSVPQLSLGGESILCYNVDGTTLKTILRAKVGIMILDNGVIKRKANCRDIL